MGIDLYQLKAIHPAVKVLSWSLLTGWLANENIRSATLTLRPAETA